MTNAQLNMIDLDQLSDLLGLSTDEKITYLVDFNSDEHYFSFEILKRSGEFRNIDRPKGRLQDILLQLKLVLEPYLYILMPVHGFIKGKGIKTNAEAHLGRPRIARLDLKDFFGSIKESMIYNSLKSLRLKLTDESALAISRLVCHKGRLPQGSPCSPLISNIVFFDTDKAIRNYCKNIKVFYTRYADDLTFSASFPTINAEFIKHIEIILEEYGGFEINQDKTRFYNRSRRMSVNNITVNEKLNVSKAFYRNTRAIIHSIKTHGLEYATAKYFSKNPVASNRSGSKNLFRIVKGRIEFIGFIGGYSNPRYIRLVKALQDIWPDYKIDLYKIALKNKIQFNTYTEGHTDHIYIQTALKKFQERGLYENVQYIPRKNKSGDGDANLKKRLEIEYQTDNHLSELKLFIFDRDVKSYAINMRDTGKEFKYWGNGCYSLVIPVPDFRAINDETDICIEMYFKDDDLKKRDSNDRRIYTKKEFAPDGYFHPTESVVYIDSKTSAIRDASVRDYSDPRKRNVAMTKNDFAKNIQDGSPPFDSVDYESFSILLDEFNKIGADFISRQLNDDIQIK